MAEKAERCALFERKHAVVFQKGGAFLSNFCNQVFFVFVKVGSAVEAALVILSIRAVVVAAHRICRLADKLFQNVVELVERKEVYEEGDHYNRGNAY